MWGGCFLLLTMYLRPYCIKSLKEDQNMHDAGSTHSELQYDMPKIYKNRFPASSLKRIATPASLFAGGSYKNRIWNLGKARFCTPVKMLLHMNACGGKSLKMVEACLDLLCWCHVWVSWMKFCHSWLSKGVTDVIYKVLTVTSCYSECNRHRWIAMKTIVRKETRPDSIWTFLIRACHISAVPSIPKWGLSITAKLFTWQFFL